MNETLRVIIEKYYFWMVLSTFRQIRKLLKKSQSLHPSNLATNLYNLVLYILIGNKALRVIIERRFYFCMVLSTFKQTRKLLKKSQSLHPSNLAIKLDSLVLYILNIESFIIFFIEESKNLVSNLTSAFITTILWQIH
jgi:hypothetical protein